MKKTEIPAGEWPEKWEELAQNRRAWLGLMKKAQKDHDKNLKGALWEEKHKAGGVAEQIEERKRQRLQQLTEVTFDDNGAALCTFCNTKWPRRSFLKHKIACEKRSPETRKRKELEQKQREECRLAKQRVDADAEQATRERKKREKFSAAWEPAIEILRRNVELQSGQKPELNLTKILLPKLTRQEIQPEVAVQGMEKRRLRGKQKAPKAYTEMVGQIAEGQQEFRPDL